MERKGIEEGGNGRERGIERVEMRERGIDLEEGGNGRERDRGGWKWEREG